MMKAQTKVLPIFCILLMLPTACFKLQRAEFPEKRYFMLDIKRPEDAFSAGRTVNLRMHRLRVSPEFEGKNFVYRTGPMTYEADYYNQFFISPADMLTRNVREWLRSSGLFQSVLDSSGLIDTPFVLQAEVLSFYGDFQEKRSPKAVLAMGIYIINTSEAGSGIVFQKKYHEASNLSSSNPDDLVLGWNECLKRIMISFEKEVVLLLSGLQ